MTGKNKNTNYTHCDFIRFLASVCVCVCVHVHLQVYDTNGCFRIYFICVLTMETCTQPISCDHMNQATIYIPKLSAVLFIRLSVYSFSAKLNNMLFQGIYLLHTHITSNKICWYDIGFLFENDSHYFHTPSHTVQQSTRYGIAQQILLSDTFSLFFCR